MLFFNALLAAVGLDDLIKIAVILLIFVIPAIGQLVAKLRQIPPPDKRPLPPRPAPPDVADEIEKFLRRTVQRRPAQDTRPVRAQEPSPPVAEPVRAEVVGEQRVGGQVTEHVKEYLDEQDFTRRGDQLGKEVAQVDQKIGQHLQQVFDHRVSKLETVPGEAAAPPVAYEPPDLVGTAADIPDTFATGLLGLITSPDSLRQAIILSEILHRPEERWA